MADIFLSYSSRDRERVRPLVQALEDQGWSVWWDQQIQTGQSWDRQIEAALEEAGACVTAFTETSVDSQWVRNESIVAMEGQKLFPVRLDDVAIPLAFRSLQMADLQGWTSGEHPNLTLLIESLAEHMGFASTVTPVEHKPVRSRAIGWIVGAAAVLVAIFAFIVVNDWNAPVDEGSVAESRLLQSEIPFASVVVLPFENLSTSDENAFFATGVYEDLLNNLTRIPDLTVISRNSAERAMQNDPRMRDLAEELGVAHVLVGTVQRAGNQVRVSIRLVDARTDSSVWGESYQRELDDIFAIQSEIASAVAERLSLELDINVRQAMASGPTNNLEAYDLFVEARELYRNLRVSTDNIRAVAAIDRAIELDPGFADAYALRAVIKGSQMFRTDDHTGVEPKVMADINRAFELDEDNPQAHLSMAQWSIGFMKIDLETAEYHARRAVESNVADAHLVLSRVLVAQGQIDEALRHLKLAEEVDPLDGRVLMEMATLLELKDRHEEAVGYVLKSIEQDPGNSTLHWRAGRFFTGSGDPYRGLQYFASARELDPKDQAVIEFLVTALAAVGAGEIATRWADLMPGLGANRDWVHFVKFLALEGEQRPEALLRHAQLWMGDSAGLELPTPLLANAKSQLALEFARAGDDQRAAELRRSALADIAPRITARQPGGVLKSRPRLVELTVLYAILLAQVGDTEEFETSEKLLHKIVGEIPAGTEGMASVVALAALDEKVRAIELFDHLVATDLPPVWSVEKWGLDFDPVYHQIHNDPRFVEVAQRLKRRNEEVLTRARRDIPSLFMIPTAE